MAKFKVTWTAHYNCSATVEAGNECEAMTACFDLEDDMVKRELDGTSDWAARKEEQQK